VEALAEDDTQRTDFLKACLLKLGLQVNEEDTTVPSLSRLHLSSSSPSGTAEIMESLKEIITKEDGERFIKDDNDTFHLEKPSAWSIGSIVEELPSVGSEKTNQDALDTDMFLDYDKVVKRLIIHDTQPPASKETPYFSHEAFYANLKHYAKQTKGGNDDFGKYILYGEVVTSTNTMLEKYAFFLRVVHREASLIYQKHRNPPPPSSRLHSNCRGANRRPRPRLQRMGVPRRFPHILNCRSAPCCA